MYVTSTALGDSVERENERERKRERERQREKKGERGRNLINTAGSAVQPRSNPPAPPVSSMNRWSVFASPGFTVCLSSLSAASQAPGPARSEVPEGAKVGLPTPNRPVVSLSQHRPAGSTWLHDLSRGGQQKGLHV